MWDATTSNLYNITLTNCPNIETITFNQNTIDGENSLGVAFKEGTVLDLSGLFNLKHIRSNVGVKGLSKLILPLTVKSLVFDHPHDTTYSLGESDIVDIFSKRAVHDNDDFHGMDLIGIDTITDFSMGSLTKMNNAINLNIKITDTFPYFNYFKTDNYFKPTGTVDISEYTGSLEHLFKGVDLDRLNVVCNNPLPHTSGRYMFAFASGQNVEVLNTLFSYMPNVTDFSYMFYNGFLKHAPYIPTRAENVSYMFYNNTAMETTPSNWNQSYINTPISEYCYTGCANIVQIDDGVGSIDVIPATWGGYDRRNIPINGETIDVEKTLEREFVNFTISGQTYQNIVPRVGQTPTIVANKSEQQVGEGRPSNVTITDGEMPYAELEGFTLVNLASEKRSGEFKCNKESNNIRNGLNSSFKIDNGAKFPHAILEGLSLRNIVPENGITPIITNDSTKYKINNNLEDSIFIKDGKMEQFKIYGRTLFNVVSKNTSPLYTNNEISPSLICSGNDFNLITSDDVFDSLVIYGKTDDTGNSVATSSNSITFKEHWDGVIEGTIGSYIDNGTEKFSVNSFRTDYIEVPNDLFIVINPNRYKRINYYDENKKHIRQIYIDTTDNMKVFNNLYSENNNLIIPSNAKYMIYSASINGTDYTNKIKIKLYKGTIWGNPNPDIIGYPILKMTDGKGKENIILVDEEITLRSDGSLKDTLDLTTGVLTARVEGSTSKKVNVYTITQDGKLLDGIKWIKDGYIESVSEVIPNVEYTVHSSNYYKANISNGVYTLYFKGNPSTITIGGNVISNPISGNLITLSNVSNDLITSDSSIYDVMLIKDDVRNLTFDYFKETRSVSGIEMQISNPNFEDNFGKGGRRI